MVVLVLDLAKVKSQKQFLLRIECQKNFYFFVANMQICNTNRYNMKPKPVFIYGAGCFFLCLG